MTYTPIKTITHRFTKANGGYNVETFLGGLSAAFTWTLGSKRDAQAVAKEHVAKLTGVCICPHFCCRAFLYDLPCDTKVAVGQSLESFGRGVAS